MIQTVEALARFIKLYREDPCRFVVDCFKVKPERWQERVLSDLAEPGAHVAVKSGHGVGKSALDSWAVIWFLATHYPCKIPCTAPTSHQLEDILWSELGKWTRRLDPFLQKQISFKTDRISLTAAPQEAYGVARTARAEKPEALQGFHSDNLLFVIDEASGVEEVIFEVAQGALSTKGARVLMTANPTRTSGYFYDAFHRMRSRWKLHHVSCFDSTQVDPMYMEDVALKYGKDSNVWKVRVEGDFPVSDNDVLIPLHLIEDAIVRELEPSNLYRPIWGLDVARYGNDRCALAKRVGNHLPEPVISWEGHDLMESVGRVIREWRDTDEENRPVEICVDVIGLGSGVYDRLNELGLPVVGVNVGERALDPGFVRLRDELWWRARQWFESRAVKVAIDEALFSELADVKYKANSAGKIEIERKDDMKKRGLRSPDLADAFCLTFSGGETIREGQTSWRERFARRRKVTNWMAA